MWQTSANAADSDKQQQIAVNSILEQTSGRYDEGCSAPVSLFGPSLLLLGLLQAIRDVALRGAGYIPRLETRVILVGLRKNLKMRLFRPLTLTARKE
jgi:hypothetical protein